MDLGRVISGAALYPAALDGLDRRRAYTQAGRALAVANSATAFEPVDGVKLCDWWADRCRVDLFGLGSNAGATVRFRLVCSNSDTPTETVTLFDRGVVVPPGSKGSPLVLTLGIASGWLATCWALLVQVSAPGEVAEFSARYTLDHAGAGLYTAFGDGTIP